MQIWKMTHPTAAHMELNPESLPERRIGPEDIVHGICNSDQLHMLVYVLLVVDSGVRKASSSGNLLDTDKNWIIHKAMQSDKAVMAMVTGDCMEMNVDSDRNRGCDGLDDIADLHHSQQQQRLFQLIYCIHFV